MFVLTCYKRRNTIFCQGRHGVVWNWEDLGFGLKTHKTLPIVIMSGLVKLNDESVAFCRPGDKVRPDQFVGGSVRDALTWDRVLGSSRFKHTRVELTPHTGRGHQLRLHTASLGDLIISKSSSE